MKNKILPWLIVVSAYLSIVPFFVASFAVGNNSGTGEEANMISTALSDLSLEFSGVTLLLCFIHLIVTLVGYSKPLSSPFATTMAVKLALIPFYILSGLLWISLGLGAIAMLFFGGLLLGVFLVMSVAGAYFVMVATGLQNVVYLLKRSFQERTLRYAIYIVLHFFFCADVVAAILLRSKEKSAGV